MATLITAHDNLFIYILYKNNYFLVTFFSYWVSVMCLSVLYVTVQIIKFNSNSIQSELLSKKLWLWKTQQGQTDEILLL